MTTEVTQISEQLHKLSKVRLHFIYAVLIDTGVLPRPLAFIPYDCHEDKIRHVIFHLTHDQMRGHALLSNIKFMLDNDFHPTIPEQNFEWIDLKNHRQCIYFWLYIRSLKPPAALVQTDRWGNEITIYDNLGLPPMPSSAKTCIELAKDFLYIWNVDQTTKIHFIQESRLAWEKASKFKHKMLKNLQKDIPELTLWFDEYSYKNFLFSLPKIEINTFSEKLPLVLAKIDSWNTPDTQKIVALDKAYNSMAGKKFKQKPTDQRGANFWLGADQIRMISQIAKQKKMSERDALLSLINDAYIKIDT